MSGMRRGAACFLLVIGLTQMIGQCLDIPALKGIGAATMASPAPKVFSSVQGLETFSTRYILEWTDIEDQKHSLELDKTSYKGLRGPYNRRNVYGALLAFGPVLASRDLTKPMYTDIVNFSVEGQAPLLKSLKIDPYSIKGPLTVRYLTRPGSKLDGLPSQLELRKQ